MNLIERRVVMHAGRCGHHFTPDCTSCQSALDCTNVEIDSLHSEIERLTAQVETMRKACEGIADDYMTSEQHHPNYVLIPAIKFEEICAALSYRGGDCDE